MIPYEQALWWQWEGKFPFNRNATSGRTICRERKSLKKKVKQKLFVSLDATDWKALSHLIINLVRGTIRTFCSLEQEQPVFMLSTGQRKWIILCRMKIKSLQSYKLVQN